MYDQGESKDDRMVDLIDVWWSRELVYIYINNQVAGNSHPILGLATRFSTEAHVVYSNFCQPDSRS